MKKLMFIAVGMLFSISVSAATISLSSSSSTGGGTTANGSGIGGATATHTDLQSDFVDVWQVSSTTTLAETFNIATSTPTFTTFDAFYSFDGTTWVDFANESILGGINESEYQTLTGSLVSYLIKVTGTGVSIGSSSYLLSVNEVVIPPVPVPAALFLFAPALLGFLGFRRKAAMQA